MSRRTIDQEIAAFKRRCKNLFVKEARCPACQKARRENPMVSEELKARVDDPAASSSMPPCGAHQRIRRDMAISGMKTWG